MKKLPKRKLSKSYEISTKTATSAPLLLLMLLGAVSNAINRYIRLLLRVFPIHCFSPVSGKSFFPMHDRYPTKRVFEMENLEFGMITYTYIFYKDGSLQFL